MGLFIGEDDEKVELIGERYDESRVGVELPDNVESSDRVESRSLGDTGKNVLISGIIGFLLEMGESLVSRVTALRLERGDRVRGL